MTIMEKIRYGCLAVAAILIINIGVYVWGPSAFGSDTARIVVVALGLAAAAACVVLAIVLPGSVMRTIAPVVIDVTLASRQVLGAASQVTSSAVETATAITQAATTVDEVRQTALLANQKATGLCDLSRDGEAVAEGGRQAITEIVDGMGRVRDQIGTVAETVVKLSDQTKAADQIIQTTNMLAEQSNLLSVNAAIEAAGAGEYGKGFGVVAEEIRNLATQSKQAAQQVRSILAEIEHATDAAVMATEQGSKTIAVNLHRTADSAAAIESLTDGVDKSAQGAQQIAASTQQQLIGMDQISQAMESINTAGIQNAASARQMESEAARLDDAAVKLARLIGYVKMGAPADGDQVRADGQADAVEAVAVGAADAPSDEAPLEEPHEDVEVEPTPPDEVAVAERAAESPTTAHDEPVASPTN